MAHILPWISLNCTLVSLPYHTLYCALSGCHYVHILILKIWEVVHVHTHTHILMNTNEVLVHKIGRLQYSSTRNVFHVLVIIV